MFRSFLKFKEEKEAFRVHDLIPTSSSKTFNRRSSIDLHATSTSLRILTYLTRSAGLVQIDTRCDVLHSASTRTR